MEYIHDPNEPYNGVIKGPIGDIVIKFSETEECKIDKADRGWFGRRHKECTDKKDYINGCSVGYDSYQLVLTYAIVCGVSWIGAGVVSFLASKTLNKMFAQLSLLIYMVGFIIFVGLFGSIMTQINEIRHELEDFDAEKYCDEEIKQTKKSGNEFTGYSICSFITILISIALLCVSIYSLGDTVSNESSPRSNKYEKSQPKPELTAKAAGLPTENDGNRQ